MTVAHAARGGMRGSFAEQRFVGGAYLFVAGRRVGVVAPVGVVLKSETAKGSPNLARVGV